MMPVRVCIDGSGDVCMGVMHMVVPGTPIVMDLARRIPTMLARLPAQMIQPISTAIFIAPCSADLCRGMKDTET